MVALGFLSLRLSRDDFFQTLLGFFWCVLGFIFSTVNNSLSSLSGRPLYYLAEPYNLC